MISFRNPSLKSPGLDLASIQYLDPGYHPWTWVSLCWHQSLIKLLPWDGKDGVCQPLSTFNYSYIPMESRCLSFSDSSQIIKPEAGDIHLCLNSTVCF